jgi:hypothetical protein
LPVKADHIGNAIAIEIDVGKLRCIETSIPWHWQIRVIKLYAHLQSFLGRNQDGAYEQEANE